MGFKKSDPSRRKHRKISEMDGDDRKSKKIQKIRQERKRSKEVEYNLFRHVRDFDDLLESDLDNLN